MANPLPILNHSVDLDAGGNVFFEPYSIESVNRKGQILKFNNSGARDMIRGHFEIPTDFVSGAKLLIVWSSAIVANALQWELDYRSVGGSDTESMDQATFQQTLGLTTGAGEPSVAHERMTDEIPMTDADLAADDTCQFEFGRDSGDAADTKAGPAWIVGLFFKYVAA